MTEIKKTLTNYARANLEHWINGNKVAFAKKINVSESTISRIFKDRKISPGTISKINDVYGYTENEFLNSYLFQEQDISKIFGKHYYAYFYALEDHELIDRANIEIKGDGDVIDFTIVLENSKREKKFTGNLVIDENFFCFNLTSLTKTKYHGFIMMPRPNISPDKKYYGGLGFICLPIYQDLIPRVGKVFISNTRLKLTDVADKDFKFLMEKLKMAENNLFTISQDDSLKAGRYITEKIHADIYFE